ncbi:MULTISPECIES: hypothetical protein [unclassified Mammaliicoccus]|uniref:hypothetical protein n=1 Tax=unclassified Mammaliicoccus TaxID=2803851 RepID=UPI001EFA306F|nr:MULTISPECIES: hypothetical protein [unclassified Mammaliicoccus]
MNAETLVIEVNNKEYLTIKKASRILKMSKGQALLKHTYKHLEEIVKENEVKKKVRGNKN